MWSDSDIIGNELRTFESHNLSDDSLESKIVMERSSTPRLKRDGFTFTWRIENFSSFGKKTGEFIQSPIFLVEKLDKTEWYLRLYPRGDVDQDYIACYLYRKKVDSGPEKIAIGYNISFLTVDGSPNLSGQVEKLTFSRNKGFGNTKFKKRDDLLKKKKAYLPKDTLTVRCHMWKCFFEKSMVKKCFAFTRLDVEKCLLTWSIKNFSACESGVKQDVPFVPASTKVPPLDIKWYINGDSGNFYLDIIQHGKKCPSTVYVNCSICLVDSKGDRESVMQREHFFEANRDDQTWSLPPLFEKNKILSNREIYLLDDTLTIACKLFISMGEETSSIEESNFKPLSSQGCETQVSKFSSLKKDFYSLYMKKKFCDVTLRTGTKCFYAHKAILSSRSAVFCALLDDDKFEENGNVINVHDVDEITLNDMLLYIYSDTLNNLGLENAIKLYCAADKYQISSLKNVCCHFLKSILTVSNVCLVLALADEHKDNDLKTFIQEFICNNASEIFHSKQWKEFMERKMALASEMMLAAWKNN